MFQQVQRFYILIAAMAAPSIAGRCTPAVGGLLFWSE